MIPVVHLRMRHGTLRHILSRERVGEDLGGGGARSNAFTNQSLYQDEIHIQEMQFRGHVVRSLW